MMSKLRHRCICRIFEVGAIGLQADRFFPELLRPFNMALYDKRVAAGKDALGTDGRSGRPVKTCVVISEPDGAVVTMYPGR